MSKSVDVKTRNLRILELHNEGKNHREIMSDVGISLGTVSGVIKKALKLEEIPPKEKVEVVLSGKEERFDSFVGWVRTDVNVYANEKTGELVSIAFVKAKEEGGFGYFVKVDLCDNKVVKAEKKIEPQVVE